MRAWLETTSGDKIPIQGNCSLGRDQHNTLILPDNQVSRRHAMIHLQGRGEHWLVDLGSSNGTLLNGRRVRQPIALKDSDQVSIGSDQMTFRCEETPADDECATVEDDVTFKRVTQASMWMVIADIEDFTPLSQTMPVETLSKLVGRWILHCTEIIEKHFG